MEAYFSGFSSICSRRQFDKVKHSETQRNKEDPSWQRQTITTTTVETSGRAAALDKSRSSHASSNSKETKRKKEATNGYCGTNVPFHSRRQVALSIWYRGTAHGMVYPILAYAWCEKRPSLAIYICLDGDDYPIGP